MKNVLHVIHCLLIAFAGQALQAADPVKVFILAGQSNMEGQAVVWLTGKDYNDGKGTLGAFMKDAAKAPTYAHLVTPEGKGKPRDDVFVRYQREGRPLLAGPLDFGFSVYGDAQHFGPELQFGHVLGDFSEAPVLLIKTAWGGKSLYADFRPPSAGGEVGKYYKLMIAQVREALTNLDSDFPSLKGRGHTLAGFVWYQGWNDGVNPKTAIPEYEENLVHLIHDVRREFAAPKLPVVIGELTGAWVNAPPEWEKLRAAQAAAAKRPEFAGTVQFVPTRDFVRKSEESPNPTHGHHEFGNAETYFLVGDALGKSMVSLLKAAGSSNRSAPESAQEGPYMNAIPAHPPYYRVRYEGSTKPAELVYPASFTVWIPPGVKTLRGVVVHQHGCGEGSCKSGFTGAFDLHWQALAKKHDCALLSATYEQPEKANCQLWCDPRNGSDVSFQQALADLGAKSNHAELATVPWAIWGHSGGGHWAGAMLLLHPERVAAAWLRSGVPPIATEEGKPAPYQISLAACQVPMMCNLGTKEGVTEKAGRFSGVWPRNETFFHTLRGKGALIGVAIDPLSSHDCGNQRYLAIPWFDACLTARLPSKPGEPLQPMAADRGWLAPLNVGEAKGIAPVAATQFTGDVSKSVWLPGESVAKSWMQYQQDSNVNDDTPPPAPTNLRVTANVLTWSAEADLESGLASFIIERNGEILTQIPAQGKNPFGRPVFQNLSYSDTPTQPLMEMRFTDTSAESSRTYQYRVIAVNTVGLKSK
jgi:pimeloyl-ACP methyl ester carboxylesterase